MSTSSKPATERLQDKLKEMGAKSFGYTLAPDCKATQEEIAQELLDSIERVERGECIEWTPIGDSVRDKKFDEHFESPDPSVV